MSLWDKISTIWSSNNGNKTVARDRKFYIVDAATLNATNGNRTRLAPRNQMDILKGLVRFARKEKIELCTVFEGKPLRHAPDKQKFQDCVLVHYAANSEALSKVVLGVLRSNSRGQQVTIITSDKLLEKKACEQGAQVMRGATFKKALENSGVSLEESKPQGSKRRSNGPNQRQQRKRAPKAQDNRGQRKKSKNTDDDPVRDLIDLVEEKPKAPKADKAQQPNEKDKQGETAPKAEKSEQPQEKAAEKSAAPKEKAAEPKPETAEVS